MVTLEQLTPNAVVRGILPAQPVTVIATQWHGTDCITLTYKEPDGRIKQQLLYRSDEAALSLEQADRPWLFTADGHAFRRAAEARRIRLAHLFDPLLAVHTSDILPLPHQITAVYQQMLPRQPLRFLLADDPGAGKTIMAGLLIKELIARGDVQRCLIVCPGNLAEQWQDELDRKFALDFQILTNDNLEAARTRNWFLEHDRIIARLDKLARDEDAQLKVAAPDCQWDLIICDEAHKLSASVFGNEVKYTKRYRLAQNLAERTRHLLLMTATPHNGKEEDFRLFLSLLDADRFEAQLSDTRRQPTDAADIMRRMVKEDLVKFDATPLFPMRIANTLSYTLSQPEAALYAAVTQYVREEFNRADALGPSDKRKGTVGFALTILQRRLASSPEAILKSLQRRLARLETQLNEMELNRRGALALNTLAIHTLSLDDIDDLEDAPETELAQAEDKILDQATAASTIAELRTELSTLKRLERQAAALRSSGEDVKWQQLRGLLEQIFTLDAFPRSLAETAAPYDTAQPIPQPAPSPSQKLVIFTEHRDTLAYLYQRIATLFGHQDAVVAIHGALPRDQRRNAQNHFINDPRVKVLIATDAAGEGINLQRAHLMVNYDLPWNPNRLEQRFGRIHRIGQTEVCHLWNLVASETREGDVYHTLLAKLEEARKALGGQVFDVLGKLQFDGKPLRELLIEAIRFGEQPHIKAHLSTILDDAFDPAALQALLSERALTHEVMNRELVFSVRADMERAEARRLQPYYIKAFFLPAFRELGGSIHRREGDRYEITRVPESLRSRYAATPGSDRVLRRYERVAFDKAHLHGSPPAQLLCPGHPLLDALVDEVYQRHGHLLRRGCILVDERDPSTTPRLLFAVEHEVHDGTRTRNGEPRTLSKRILYLEMDQAGQTRSLPYAPYLDYRSLAADEPSVDQILARPECAWIAAPAGPGSIEDHLMAHAIAHVAPAHMAEVTQRQLAHVEKTRSAVRQRLNSEIRAWDFLCAKTAEDERAGKKTRYTVQEAERRRDGLIERLNARMEQLDLEERLTSLPPVSTGAVLVLPLGLLARMTGSPPPALPSPDTQAAAAAARAAVMQIERDLGYTPVDRELEKVGYDIESRDPKTGSLRWIEVKGRIADADTITVTRNELLYALGAGDKYILALVLFQANGAPPVVRYLQHPFQREPDADVISVNYDFAELLGRALPPFRT